MPTLTNNAGTITRDNQKNVITLSTNGKYVNSNITLTTKVTKAVLNKTAEDTDRKTFQIQIPNGDVADLILTFTTDTSGNTVVTGTNAT